MMTCPPPAACPQRVATNGSVLLPVLLGHPLPQDAWVTQAGIKLALSLQYQGQQVQVGSWLHGRAAWHSSAIEC
jgi:hypothetical protein